MKKLLIILLSFICLNTFAATYYVSNTGNNSNSGLTTALAWQTISKVNSTIVAGDIVLLNRGDVWYEALETNVDGNASNHITFGAYGTGANPKISGFTTLTGWTNNGGGIYYASLAVTNLNMVTIDGVARGMGRYPDSGYLNYESHTGNTSITDNQLTGTPNWTGAQIGIRKQRWIIDRHTVTSQSTNTLNYNALEEFGNNTAYSPVNGNGYFFQNDIKCLDDFGDWCFDVATQRVYMYFGAETPTTYVIKASSAVYNAKGRSYSYYNNIDFEGANRIGYYESGGHSNMHFTDCNFINQGGNALYAANSSYLTITGGSISTAISNGVHFEGAVPNVTIDGLTVSNCGDILGAAKSGDAAGIGIYVSGDNTIIRNCSVTNSGYHGIYFNGSNVLIENNFVDSFCKVKDDGGGIYTYTSSASTIQNNIVINAIGSYAGAEAYSYENYGKAAGIYIDDGVALHNAIITGNTLVVSEWAGILINVNGGSSITNNTVFNCKNGLGFASSNVGEIRNMTVTGNKFIAKTATQWPMYSQQWSGDNPALFGTFNNNYYARPISDVDVIRYSTDGWAAFTNFTLSEWKTYSGKDAASLGSPYTISSETELQLVYNKEATSQPIALTGVWKNLSGTEYDQSITLSPYTSSILYYVGEHQEPVVRTKGISAGGGKMWGIGGVVYGN